MSCTCECVSSCEHCAFIIFNAIPESQRKAANEAHRLSQLQESTPAVYWLPPPISSLLTPHSFTLSVGLRAENYTDAPMIRGQVGQGGPSRR